MRSHCRTGGAYNLASLHGVPSVLIERGQLSLFSREEIEADIATVQGELSALRSSLSGARTVTAEHSGTYSAACDGYESLLTPDFLQSVTPSQLEGLPSGQTGGSSLGKLIIGEKWYYTAVITAEQAQQLEKGDWLTLRFSKGAQQDIDAQVTYLSAAEDGKQAVVLTCREYLAQTSCAIRRLSWCCGPMRDCGSPPTPCG